MTRAGKRLHQKRLSSPASWPVARKGYKFVPKISAGAHSKEFGMPLTILLRDVLGVAQTAQESKYIVNSQVVKVDGKVRNRERLTVGHMDIVEFEGTDMRYRIQLHTSNKLIAKPITKKEAAYKVARVIGKRNLRGGLTQISLHDGRNILLENSDKQLAKIKVQHSLRVNVPTQEIKEILPLEEGSRVQVTLGRHQGKIGTVMEIHKKFGPKASEVIIQDEDGDQTFRTALEYVFVIGKLELAR
jgi:small subunit ribosomal protein S4e